METLKDLQLLYAKHKNKPITNVEIFKEVLESESKFEHFKNIVINDEEWINTIKNKWWYHENNTSPLYNGIPYVDTKIFELRDKLLEFGGSEVCLPNCEEDLENILKYGQIWYCSFEKRKGVPCQCHRNSCYLWKNNQDYANGSLRICTGYALSKDGMWRQHSWLVYKTPRSSHIIETTEERVLYFGFVMTTEMCWDFYSDNL